MSHLSKIGCRRRHQIAFATHEVFRKARDSRFGDIRAQSDHIMNGVANYQSADYKIFGLSENANVDRDLRDWRGSRI